jgi:hypothetical protein
MGLGRWAPRARRWFPPSGAWTRLSGASSSPAPRGGLTTSRETLSSKLAGTLFDEKGRLTEATHIVPDLGITYYLCLVYNIAYNAMFFSGAIHCRETLNISLEN